jgi:hypothetical protein
MGSLYLKQFSCGSGSGLNQSALFGQDRFHVVDYEEEINKIVL